MKIKDKTYRELTDLKEIKQGYYYTWLINISITSKINEPMIGVYMQKSLKTKKVVAQGKVIY